MTFIQLLPLFQSTSKADKSSGMSRHRACYTYFAFTKWYYTPFFPPAADSKARKEKLEQVAAFSLFGNVMSMASVQLVGASRDALLLSFKDAKVPLPLFRSI